MDIDRDVPPDGEFNFVIVFPTRPAGVRHTVSNFDEIRDSKTLPWPDEWPLPHVSRDGHGAAPTREQPDTVWFFVRERYLRDRCARMGGLDVTEAWVALGKLRAGEKTRLEVVQGKAKRWDTKPAGKPSPR